MSDPTGTGPPWAFVIEFFTRLDSEAIDRLLEYLPRFRGELRHGPHNRDRYPFAGALVFLTGEPVERDLDMVVPDEPEVGLGFHPRVRCFAEQDAVKILDLVETGQYGTALLPWISLMRGGAQPEVIDRWKVLSAAKTDLRRRGI